MSPISPAQRVGRPILHVAPRSTRRRTYLREASACVSRIPRQRDSAISGRMLDCRIGSTGIRQPVSFRQVVPGSPFLHRVATADGRMPVFVDGCCARPYPALRESVRSGARISEEKRDHLRGTAGRRRVALIEEGAERNKRRTPKPLSQRPPRRRCEQHLAASLSGAAKHCFTSKDPCGSVWRFSEKQNLTHFRMRHQVAAAALFRATDRFLNLPPERPLRRPARCWLPLGRLPRPEPDCKSLPARNLPQGFPPRLIYKQARHGQCATSVLS